MKLTASTSPDCGVMLISSWWAAHMGGTSLKQVIIRWFHRLFPSRRYLRARRNSGPLYRISGVWSGAIALTRLNNRPGWDKRELFGGALGCQALDYRFGHMPPPACELIPDEVLSVTQLLVAARDPALRSLIVPMAARERTIISALTPAEVPLQVLPAELAALTPAERQASAALNLWQAWLRRRA